MFNVVPNIITDIIIDIGCRFTTSENNNGTRIFPSINCINVYIKIIYKKLFDAPRCTADINITGMAIIIAPMYGIITDIPTIIAKRSEYAILYILKRI